MQPTLTSWLGDDSFTDPQDIIYACIRDDNLIKLEHLLISPQDTALTTVAKPGFDRGNAGGWGTPLHFAAWLGNVDAVKMLLNAGADPTINTPIAIGEGDDGASPILLAIEAGHRSVVTTLWKFAGPIPGEIEEPGTKTMYT